MLTWLSTSAKTPLWPIFCKTSSNGKEWGQSSQSREICFPTCSWLQQRPSTRKTSHLVYHTRHKFPLSWLWSLTFATRSLFTVRPIKCSRPSSCDTRSWRVNCTPCPDHLIWSWWRHWLQHLMRSQKHWLTPRSASYGTLTSNPLQSPPKKNSIFSTPLRRQGTSSLTPCWTIQGLTCAKSIFRSMGVRQIPLSFTRLKKLKIVPTLLE